MFPIVKAPTLQGDWPVPILCKLFTLNTQKHQGRSLARLVRERFYGELNEPSMQRIFHSSATRLSKKFMNWAPSMFNEAGV